MAVLMFEQRFWDPVLSGQKVHSIRPTRKRPIIAGDQLSLRGWSGKAYRSPQRILAEETCIDVRTIRIDFEGIEIDGYDRIDELDELNCFARTDGFADWNDMRMYREFAFHMPFAGSFIQWGPNKFLTFKTIG